MVVLCIKDHGGLEFLDIKPHPKREQINLLLINLTKKKNDSRHFLSS